MVGVLCAVRILQMAADAVGAGSGKIIVGVARRAFQFGMCTRKGEAGKLRVVEFCSHPAIQRVTLLAICWITHRCVTRIAGLGIVS